MIRGRFAPSPSGRMHLGNLWSALLAWLSARSVGGEMVLRLEDLDPDRCRRTYCDQVMRDLEWFGLDWDNKPVYQSERTEFYREMFDRLTERGLLYPCYCTRAERLAASAPHLSDGAQMYGGQCRDLSPEERAVRAKSRKPAWRIRVPDKTVRFDDLLYGPQQENLAQDCGDFILRRSDGVYAYQLAVVADDWDMGVTQVVRGRDLLTSAPRQIWLWELLGGTPPQFGHVPLLLAPDGRRLAKRDRDQELGWLQARFTAPELVGRLAYWAGLLPEYAPVTPSELLPLFDWKKIPVKDRAVPALDMQDMQDMQG